MMRHGNRLAEDRFESAGPPKRRAHPLTVKLDADTLAALRAEARAAGLSVSAVVRLAIRDGLHHVTAARIARRAGIAPDAAGR